MIALRLFDFLTERCRTIAASTVGAALFLAACGSDDSGITTAYRDMSDMLNATPEAPPPGPWRLTRGPTAPDAPFPKLSDVPPRPADLPRPDALANTTAALAADNRAIAAGQPIGLSAAQLGAPRAAQVASVTIPGVGTFRHSRPTAATGSDSRAPSHGSPAATLPLTAKGEIAPEAFAVLAAFTRGQRHRTGHILIGVPAGHRLGTNALTGDPGGWVRDHLIAEGIAPSRLRLTEGREREAVTLTVHPPD